MSASYGDAGDPGYASNTPAVPGRGVGTRETLALIFLTVGSLLCSVLGWMVGTILLWTSTTWTGREKLIGTLILPGGLAPAALLVVGGIGAYSCGSASWSGPDGVVHHTREVCNGGPWPTWLAVATIAVLVAAPIITTIWLARAASRRAAAAG